MPLSFNASGNKKGKDWILPDFVIDNCMKCKYQFWYSSGCQVKGVEQYPCKDFVKKEIEGGK